MKGHTFFSKLFFIKLTIWLLVQDEKVTIILMTILYAKSHYRLLKEQDGEIFK